jgi:hypothetical protein
VDSPHYSGSCFSIYPTWGTHSFSTQNANLSSVFRSSWKAKGQTND